MVCEICEKTKIDRIVEESKKAMKRFTAKLTKENEERKNDTSKQG